jgi:hypothetical protein
MKTELEQALFLKYPSFFKNTGEPPDRSLMCFGCECGDGWYGVLDSLFGYIADVRENRFHMLDLKSEFANSNNGGVLDFRCPAVVLDQVKEKYGTLRVYWHFDLCGMGELREQVRDEAQLYKCLEEFSDLISHAVDFAEYLSSNTCEVTGKPGKLYTNGWHVTLCEEEARRRFNGSKVRVAS